MLNPKLSILTTSWLNIVFEGRNKLYGAYVIRQQANRDLSKALLFGALCFLLPIGIIMTAVRIEKATRTELVFEDREITLQELALEKYVAPIPMLSKESQQRSRLDQVKMLAPKVVPHTQATEEPPTADVLKKANPGPATIAGDPTAPIAIDMKVGAVDELTAITEGGEAQEVFANVEVNPTFPGGLKAFMEFVAKNYKFPEQAKAHGIRGKLFISFIVEKDGSLTEIEVGKDLGFGTGQEAVRLLQRAPKWKPGIQNGRPVRVRFQLPIALYLQEQ
ncbi:energy transducer TonB [Olivibacter sp. XZL3]|uniref:energy transducer TonB n=1 Tax=Olivibacter sp. XZL3 TaxID=1735116 RepID=UPI0010653B08|nr:energy transducer TonB [Olivibacter sp. XZL3]